MNKSNTSLRLKQIMSERNLKQVDILNMSKPFQAELNISLGKSTLSQYVNGKQSPDDERIYLLSKTLGVSEPWLMGYDVNKNRTPDQNRNNEDIVIIYNQLEDNRKSKVWLFAKDQLKQQKEQFNVVEASFSVTETSNVYNLEKQRVRHEWKGYVSAGTGEFLFDEQSEYVELDENEVPERSDFCLTVNGNSMEPIFKDGSYIFVEEKEEISNGSIGVVIVNNEAFVKRVWFEGDHARLESFNPKYPDKIITAEYDFKIVGKVVM